MNWKQIPYVLLITNIWSIGKLAGLSTSLLLVFAALAVEFFKSGDIGLNTFGMDTAFSVLQVICGTVTITLMFCNHKPLTLPDCLLCLVVLADAWFSPFNSFRTALRIFSSILGRELQAGQEKKINFVIVIPC